MTFIDIQGREMVLSFRGPRDVLGELSFAHAEPRSSTVGRVAARLIELCERYGDETADGVEIRLPITQEDLGSWIASSRAGVAGALRTMLELGWIRTERRRLTVLDLEALAQRAG